MNSYSTNQTSSASSKAFTTSDIYYQSVLLKARILVEPRKLALACNPVQIGESIYKSLKHSTKTATYYEGKPFILKKYNLNDLIERGNVDDILEVELVIPLQIKDKKLNLEKSYIDTTTKETVYYQTGQIDGNDLDIDTFCDYLETTDLGKYLNLNSIVVIPDENILTEI